MTFKTVLLSLAVVLGIAATVIGQEVSSAENAKPLEKNQPTITIETGRIEDIVTGQGTLEPKDYVDVGAQVSGQIKKMHVEIGDAVKTGDLIAEIDPKTYETRVAGDLAQLKTLAAQKAEQEANIKLAAQKLDRNKILFAENAVSREALEESETALQVANAQLKSIKAQIEQAQSSLDGNKVNLGYTRIYAPMDGTIVAQNIKEGQTINASQTAPVIVQVANLTVMTVRAQVAEADIMRLKTGMPVYFTTLGSQGRKWNATVRQILPSPENINDVILYNVLIDVDNTDGALMTGMTTQNFFIVGVAENVPVIPVSALGKRLPKNDNETGTAYEVGLIKDNRVVPTTIHLGIMDRKQAEIKSGLSAGDRIAAPQPVPSGGAPTSQSSGFRGGPRL